MRAGGRSVFVTHGGTQIGLGHVKRCLALARALSEEGDEITFIVSPDSTTAQFIQGAAGFSVFERTWEHRPSVLRTAVGATNIDTVVVDSYTARTEHFEALRSVAPQVVAIDDTATRRLPVDVVVNVGAGTGSLRDTYDVCEHTRLLLGSRYALLDPVYAKAPVRSGRTRVERVLVTLGASVHADALRSAIGAVDYALQGVTIGVVTGPFGAPGMIDAATHGRNKIIDYGGLPELRPVMLDADLAVTGAGVTLSELAATATPAVMVQTEPNQARNVAAFEAAGAALFAGPAAAADLHAKVLAAVRHLAGDANLRAHLGAEGRRLVDGQGARRVARELMSLATARG